MPSAETTSQLSSSSQRSSRSGLGAVSRGSSQRMRSRMPGTTNDCESLETTSPLKFGLWTKRVPPRIWGALPRRNASRCPRIARGAKVEVQALHSAAHLPEFYPMRQNAADVVEHG